MDIHRCPPSLTRSRRSLPAASIAWILTVGWLAVANPATAQVRLQIENRPDGIAHTLVGGDARLQLVVSAALPNGQQRDVTRRVHYSAQPPDIVQIDANGLVTPLANGTVSITATLTDSPTPASDPPSSTTELTVTSVGNEPPIHYQQQIVPIFTKLGCNGGGCHGKAAGQNGFRLSLLGFEPDVDLEYLVKESRGRRVFPPAPERSLLLTKATNQVPHGGGQRLAPDSYEYRLLWRWIAQGANPGEPTAPTITGLEIYPPQRRLPQGESQQLSLVAHYTDGSAVDVTAAAIFESNDPAMADVSDSGLVQLHQLVGDVAVMARFQEHVSVFTADIPRPLSADPPPAAATLPTPRNEIDVHVFEKLRSLRLPASPPASDLQFLRRVTLDITGRLPTLAETQQFANDPRPSQQKRDDWIDRLLDSEDYAEYFAGKWGAILRNRRTDGALQFRNLAFHAWLRQALHENRPYDQWVGELLTASGSPATNPAVAWFSQVRTLEERTEDAAQLFLGQRVQCARCHQHPYEKWSQADYAQLAAFFSLVSNKPSESPGEAEFYSRTGQASAKHPNTGQPLPPKGLDGAPLQIDPEDDPRAHLVDWMAAAENPFFAKMAVNRYWKHFMGRGLVEPEDDLRVTNPPSNPALMDALADSFLRSGFDLKQLIRMICQSHSYQLSSDALPENLGDKRSHSRYYPKRLAAEVLLDAVDRVTLASTEFQHMPPETRAVALPDTGFPSYFLTVFGQPQATTACECERTGEANLAQSLHLLNSEEVQGKLSAENGRAARLAATDPADDAQQIDELYQITLARMPTASERQAILDYIAQQTDRRAAMEDLVWSLLNSKEFLFNH